MDCDVCSSTRKLGPLTLGHMIAVIFGHRIICVCSYIEATHKHVAFNTHVTDRKNEYRLKLTCT